MRVTSILLAFSAAAALASSGPAAAQQNYDGDYEGVLHSPGGDLHLALHVKTQGKEVNAVLDSLDQHSTIPANAAKVENGELGVLFLNIGAELTGKLSADGKTLNGAWNQQGTLPLTMTRKVAAK